VVASGHPLFSQAKKKEGPSSSSTAVVSVVASGHPLFSQAKKKEGPSSSSTAVVSVVASGLSIVYRNKIGYIRESLGNASGMSIINHAKNFFDGMMNGIFPCIRNFFSMISIV
ncbi:MAG: hypothetical protein IKN64_03575, partial [Desulfovibrio sp.]|nr:hypothetical protein [Desulfovibrio sp.]